MREWNRKQPTEQNKNSIQLAVTKLFFFHFVLTLINVFGFLYSRAVKANYQTEEVWNHNVKVALYRLELILLRTGGFYLL